MCLADSCEVGDEARQAKDAQAIIGESLLVASDFSRRGAHCCRIFFMGSTATRDKK